MTVPQARKAHSAISEYSLCVVPVASSITTMDDEQAAKAVVTTAKFVYPIGDQLDAALSDIDSILKGESQRLNKAPENVEAAVLGNRQLRVRVREPVWSNGRNFSAFLQLLSPTVQ